MVSHIPAVLEETGAIRGPAFYAPGGIPEKRPGHRNQTGGLRQPGKAGGNQDTALDQPQPFYQRSGCNNLRRNFPGRTQERCHSSGF